MLRNIYKIVLVKLYLEIFDYHIVAKEAYLIRLDIDLEISEDLENFLDELIGMDAGEEGEFHLLKMRLYQK